MIPEQLLDEAAGYAHQQHPLEACGLIIERQGQQLFRPCRNIASEPETTFLLDPDDFAAAEDDGEVLAVMHSHPIGPADPSPDDRAACDASGVPWLIFAVETGAWLGIDPAAPVRLEP